MYSPLSIRPLIVAALSLTSAVATSALFPSHARACDPSEAIVNATGTSTTAVDATGAFVPAHTSVAMALAALPPTGGTVCVEPDPSTSSPMCGAGSYDTTASWSGVCNAHVEIRADAPGLCLVSPGTTSTPVLSVMATGRVELLGFDHIRNEVLTPMDAALFVEDATLRVSGRTPFFSTTTHVSALSGITRGVTGHANDNGIIESEMASWEESGLGILLEETSPFPRICAAIPAGSIFDSTQSNVQGNGLGFFVSGRSDVVLVRDAVRSNDRIGEFFDTSTFSANDTGFNSNRSLECTLPVAQLDSSLRMDDLSSANFHNTLWRTNCTDAPESDEPLIEALSSASVTISNSTFDNNQSVSLVKGDDTSTLTVTATIMADDAGVFPGWDSGIICAGGGVTSSLDFLVMHGLAPGFEVSGCPLPTTWTTIKPGFTSLSFKIGGTGPMQVRDYYLDASSSIFTLGWSTPTASSVGLSAPYGAKVPDLTGLSTDDHISFPADTGQVEPGWHWWGLNNATVP